MYTSISLDGVFEDPKWTFEYGFDPKMGETIAGLMGPSNAILLGRQTYQEFYRAWSTRTASRIRRPVLQRHTEVRRLTLQRAEWQSSTILGPYNQMRSPHSRTDPTATSTSAAAGTLVRGLLADRLVDELHLFVFALALGAGKRLFAEGTTTKLALVGSDVYDNGVVAWPTGGRTRPTRLCTRCIGGCL